MHDGGFASHASVRSESVRVDSDRMLLLLLNCYDVARTLWSEEKAMITESVDTGPEAERLIVAMIRQAPVSKRFRLVQSLTRSTVWPSIQAWQRSHQASSEREAALPYVLCSLGSALAQRVQAELNFLGDWCAQPADLVAAMLPALHVFEELCVPYYLARSIASSVHSMQQMARDIDLVIDRGEWSLPSLLAALHRSGYIVDEGANRQLERPHYR